MKRFFIVLGIVACSLVCFTIIKDQIVKTAVTVLASRITGAPVHIDSFSMDIFTSTIHITGFKMYNPSSFPEGVLLSCPKINVIYDRASLFTQKPHFLSVDIDLKEMVLFKDKEGKLNVDSLKVVRDFKSSKLIPMQIDLLNLSIGRIVYKSYMKDAEPSVSVQEVNRHKSYKRIPTAQQLALLVLAEPMKAAVIKDAEIYGVAFVAGVTVLPVAVAVLPVAAAVTLIGKDSVRQVINTSFKHMYEISLKAVKRMGRITKQDASNGVIKADIHGAEIALILRNGADHKTEITISARKYMLPQPEIAGGVLYQILIIYSSS